MFYLYKVHNNGVNIIQHDILPRRTNTPNSILINYIQDKTGSIIEFNSYKQALVFLHVHYDKQDISSDLYEDKYLRHAFQ